GDNIYDDKNIGNYNYEDDNETINEVIKLTGDRSYVQVKYDTGSSGNIIEINGYFRKVFTYDGYLYVIMYVPKDEHHKAIAIHRIQTVEAIEMPVRNIPEFNYDEFCEIRFGVFWGEPKDIKLEISKDFKHYFTKRFWHQTQKLRDNKNGSLFISMKVPLSYELISWIVGWGKAIKVIEPAALVLKIKDKLKETLEMY
ncbi:MAG: WYL domain-containing protein, partial [Candidatus Kapabacteria bacterium]|nr:WYL domain-containing protein [Candidatus Kapabacteria bacterium]